MVKKQYNVTTIFAQTMKIGLQLTNHQFLKNKLTQHHIIKLRKNFVSQLYESFALTQQTFCER
jgi:nucleoside recognition membrane protein YjiH